MGASPVPAYRMSMQLKIALTVIFAVGCVALRLLFLEAETRAWFHILIGSVLFLGFGLCGLFFTGIQFLTSAKWSVVLRRVIESMAMKLVAAAVLIAVVYFGAHHIYEWTHPIAVAKDQLLQWKSPFLNLNFFGIRLVVYFLIWFAGTFVLLRNSFKQDLSGDISLSQKNFKRSAVIMVLFGLTTSFAGFDLLMSLEPHWFSTIFGVYFFAGLFQSGLAMLLILTFLLVKSGALKDYVSQDHFHDIARFLFGFSVFWAYIAFSQFMLIWYGNLPEETFFFRERMNHGWEWVSLALLCIRFVIPFLVLMPFGAKRCFWITIPISCLVIFGQWLDLYWISIPALRHFQHDFVVPAMFGWKELLSGLGFVALFILIIGFILERIRLVPIKDPRLEASIHYYHH
jgi:hypothetical protein